MEWKQDFMEVKEEESFEGRKNFGSGCASHSEDKSCRAWERISLSIFFVAFGIAGLSEKIKL